MHDLGFNCKPGLGHYYLVLRSWPVSVPKGFYNCNFVWFSNICCKKVMMISINIKDVYLDPYFSLILMYIFCLVKFGIIFLNRC